ncbi:hypothetical protein F7725_001818 [Dissostichus mawsoni]|uniref:Uncharacterized protein n=1 Tax=Dissostichus mawsoni TaxID=36200 RepID=A0A7J5Y2G1_DISMA|nr:hypothetical protein F7725_001818 [Dissostichus mawsoni]
MLEPVPQGRPLGQEGPLEPQPAQMLQVSSMQQDGACRGEDIKSSGAMVLMERMSSLAIKEDEVEACGPNRSSNRESRPLGFPNASTTYADKSSNQVAECNQVNDGPPGLLVILSQLQQQGASMQVEVTSHLHKHLAKIVCLLASDAAQRLHNLCAHHHCVPVQAVAQQALFLSSQAMRNGFIQPSVLTEQLHQLHVNVSVSWPRCQLCLKEVEQPVPSRLALATQ